MSFLDCRVLVLNKMWMPIRVIPAIRAFTLLFANKASAVDPENFYAYNWEDWLKRTIKETDKIVHTVHSAVIVPEVIVLSKYDKVHKKSLRLTKRNIYLRDAYTCQYTGKQMSQSESDIDHIIPRSRGGKNTWDNMVVCSKDINRKKGDKTPVEAGLKLIKSPVKPSYDYLLIDPKKKVPESWKKFIKHKTA